MIYLVDEEIFGKTLKLFRKMKGILERCIIAGNATNCLLTLMNYFSLKLVCLYPPCLLFKHAIFQRV